MTEITNEEIFQESILYNIRRLAEIIDVVQFHEGLPLFSHIDINPTELCNRKCEFCPRHDVNSYANQNLHISLELIDRIAEELRDLEFSGGIIICGHGEPLLHPNIVEVISSFGSDQHTEIVTNGDRLSVDVVTKLYDAGLKQLLISMYDGPHQVDKMEQIMKDAGVNEHQYVLRDRWHPVEEDYGLALTNRAGTVSKGNQTTIDSTRPCHYTHYSMQIDWNGDVLVCVQDWNKHIRFGNVNTQSLFEIWKGQAMRRYSHYLEKGLRILNPCVNCNVNGTLHGSNHVKAWQEIN